MKKFSLLSALIFVTAAYADTITSSMLEDAHVDVNLSFDSVNKFTIAPRDDDEGVEYSDSRAALIGGTGTKRTRTGSEIGDFSFLGVNVGENYWRLPQNQAVGLIYLGLASYGVSNGELDAYDPTSESGGRVTGVGTWTRAELVHVTGPGEFSVWQSVSGGPKVFMASSDGIQTSDSLWSFAGGHSHYNWGFSKTGCYDVQMRAFGYENDGTANLGDLIKGRLFCLHYGIETYPAIIDGKVQLQDWLGDIEHRMVTIKLVQNGVTVSQKSQRIMKQSAQSSDPKLGRFAFGFSQRGTCDVILKPEGYLSRKLTLDVGETSSSGTVTATHFEINGAPEIDLSFISGDCDNNDIINTDDYLILSSAFDTSTGEPGFNAQADIDGSGTVTTDDYLILSSNFDLSGEA